MRSGQVVSGRFRVEAHHAQGGMGELFRATDLTSGETVAIKALRAGSGPDRERFDREARALADLRHTAIVRYVTHGRTDEGEPYLAMEWLEGEDLDHRLARGACTVDEAVTLTRRVAEGLAEAHRRGIVHRDLKPSNLFLAGGRLDGLKILDFGVARSGGARMTRTGMLVGTPGYMAPEQVSGQTDVTPAIDVFALGCVLFEALSGRPVYPGNNVMAILAKLVFEPAPRLGDHCEGAPAALEDLVARMLSKDPAARPGDAAAVLAELEGIDLGDLSARGDRPLPRAEAAPSALTEGERRVVSVLVVGQGGLRQDGGSASGASASEGETMLDGGPAASLLGKLRSELGSSDGSFTYLPNGAIVATLGGAGVVKDRVGIAARFALSLRAVVADRFIVLATGRGDGTQPAALGDTIERAVERLERCPAAAPASAPPIAIDDATAALLDARFDWRDGDLGPELWGERDEAEAVRTLLGKPAPCLGRERDLRTMEEAFRECSEESVAQAVVVTAPAGVGKSRLANELLGGLRRRGGVEVWSGQTDPFRSASPLALLGSALADAIGISGGEPLAERREAVRARVSLRVGPADVQRVAEMVGEMVGAPFPDDDSPVLRAARKDAELMASHMQAAFEDWLRAETGEGPVVLFLDELQWSDTLTVRFVDGALRRLAEAPLFVLGLGRPEVGQRFPSLWAERRLQQIRLGPLSRKASERLVVHMLGAGASKEVRERIVELADGNAFYLEELIRATAEGKTTLPETVVAMVQSRLENLEPEARRVLRAASIFGGVFWAEGVKALLGAGASLPARDWIAHLVERELCTPRPSSRLPGAELSFRHALVREGAYAMLTGEDRVLGHRLAADWLEQSGEPDARVLAEHCERSQQPERAARFYAAAAEHAALAHHVEAAIACAERGLELGAVGEVRGMLLTALTTTYLASERLTECVATGLEAIDLLPEGCARFYWVFLSLFPAITFTQPARLAEVTPRFLAAEPEADARGAFIHAATWVSVMFSLTGATALSTAMVDKMQRAAEGLDRSDVAVRAYLAGALANFHHNVREAPHACFRENDAAVTGFREIGLRTYEGIMGAYRAKALRDLGRRDEAEAALGAALRRAEEFGAQLPLMYVRLYLALVLAEAPDASRLDEAAALAEAVMAARNESLVGPGLGVLAEVERRRGDVEAALEASRAACESVAPYPAYAWALLAQRAWLLLGQGRAEEARALTAAGVARLEQLGLEGHGEVELRAALAEATRAAGLEDEARALTEVAIGRLGARAKAMPAEARAAYLRGVPANADLVTRAQALLGEPSVRALAAEDLG